MYSTQKCLSEIEYIKENESVDAAQVGANRCVPRLNASSFQGLSTLGRVSFISKSVFLSFISPPSDNSMVGIYHDSLPPHFIFLSKLVWTHQNLHQSLQVKTKVVNWGFSQSVRSCFGLWQPVKCILLLNLLLLLLKFSAFGVNKNVLTDIDPLEMQKIWFISIEWHMRGG